MSFLFFLSVSVVSLFSKAKFMEPRARPRLSLFARHRVSQEDMREDCGIEKQETEKNNSFSQFFRVNILLRNTLQSLHHGGGTCGTHWNNDRGFV
jgi:hypothetical protein